MDWELARGGGRGRRARLLAVRDVHGGAGARAGRENPRRDEEADQPRVLLSHAAGAGQRARGGVARPARALLRRARPRSARAGAGAAARAVQRGILRDGGRAEARGGELPFRAAGARVAQAREERGLQGDLVCHDGGGGALARGAGRRRDRGAGRRGRRAPRDFPVRRYFDAGGNLRAGAAGGGRGEGAGDRRGRHRRRARHRGRVRAGRGRRADRHRLHALPGVEDFRAASCGAQGAQATRVRRLPT